MNKNHIFAGIIVLALVAVYFIFFSSQDYSFDSGLEEINSFWEKQELKPEYLVSGTKVFAIEESKLNSLKADLESFKSQVKSQSDSEDKEKLLMLAELHLDLVSNALLQKKNFELIDEFESVKYNPEVLCNALNQTEELHEGLVLQKDSAESFNEKAVAFSSAYPEDNTKAKVGSLKLDVTSQQSLDNLRETLDGLKVVC